MNNVNLTLEVNTSFDESSLNGYISEIEAKVTTKEKSTSPSKIKLFLIDLKRIKEDNIRLESIFSDKISSASFMELIKRFSKDNEKVLFIKELDKVGDIKFTKKVFSKLKNIFFGKNYFLAFDSKNLLVESEKREKRLNKIIKKCKKEGFKAFNNSNIMYLKNSPYRYRDYTTKSATYGAF